MLSFRKANSNDLQLYFEWANDLIVREQSYDSNEIYLEAHKKWFEDKLKDTLCMMLVFQNEKKQTIGQVRIQNSDSNIAVISISISLGHRGYGYGSEMLILSSDFFLTENRKSIINAFIKIDNVSSKKAFEKAGFEFIDIRKYKKKESLYFEKALKKDTHLLM